MPVDPLHSHHCHEHDVSGDADWWDEHIAQFDHEYQFTRNVCVICNIQIENPEPYIGKIHDGKLPPSLCKEHGGKK